jgi:hypothetical protein
MRQQRGLILMTIALLGGLAPCFGGIMIRGDLTQEKRTKPGETYQGIIAIQNKDKETAEAKIYQTDYLFFCDGRNLYDAPGTASRSNAAWISLKTRRTSVPPGQAVEIPFTVKVPDDTMLSGTFWSMIMVEELSRPAPNPAGGSKDKIRVGIQTVLRYGVQLVTHIENSGIRKLKFVKTELKREDNKVILQLDIENTGERWLRPSLSAELFDGKGKLIGRFKGGNFRVYPATSVRMKIDLSAVPKGTYKAMVIADNKDENIFGAQYTLTI